MFACFDKAIFSCSLRSSRHLHKKDKKVNLKVKGSELTLVRFKLFCNNWQIRIIRLPSSALIGSGNSRARKYLTEKMKLICTCEIFSVF
jgi:hypothetical protein